MFECVRSGVDHDGALMYQYRLNGKVKARTLDIAHLRECESSSQKRSAVARVLKLNLNRFLTFYKFPLVCCVECIQFVFFIVGIYLCQWH